MAGGIARTIPTDVSKESTAYKGELILDQDKRIMKFKARDGSIHIIEGASYDLVYESLEYNHKLYEEVNPVAITKRVNTATMLNDRLMMYDANLSLITTKSDLVEMTGAVLTLYDKDSDKIQMILPRVRTQDVFSLYYDANNNLHYDTLNNILASMSSSFNDIYNTQLVKYVAISTYTSDKQTYFTKGAGLDETKYGTAKAITTALDTLISNVSNNYLQKGAGFDTSKYANIKAITTALETISTSLNDTGSVGSRIKTIEDNYLPKGTGFDTTKYPNIKAITVALESAATAAGNAGTNFTNYLIKGTNFDTTYPAIKSMNDIMSSITAASNNANTAKSDAASALSTVNIVEQSLVNYLVKGDGFDTTKYANLKAITTALETINSSYLPKGTSWATKYSTIASLYDVMEKVTVLEGWKSSYPTTVSSTYVPFGAMSAADKTEFPDLYSIIDNIRNADNFMSLHSGPTSQVGVHQPVMDEVDVRIATAKTLMTNAINAVDAKIKVNADNSEIRYIGRSYGEVCGYCPDDYIYPGYNEDIAYGLPAIFGVYGTMKRLRTDSDLAIKSIRMTFPGVYPIVSRSVGIATGYDDIVTPYVNSGYVTFKSPAAADTRSNDIRIYLPLYPTGESFNGWSLDFGGSDNIIVIDFIPDKVGHVLIFVCYNKSASVIEYYTYETRTKVLTKASDTCAIDVSINNIDRDFKNVDVLQGEYISTLSVRASVSARDMSFYVMGRAAGSLQTSYSTSTVTLAPGQSSTLTISVTKNGIPTSGTVTIEIPPVLSCNVGKTFDVPTSGSKTISLTNTGSQGSYNGALITSATVTSNANTIPDNTLRILRRPGQASTLSVDSTDKLIGAGACFDRTMTYSSGSFTGRASMCAIGVKSGITTIFLLHYDGVADAEYTLVGANYASAHSNIHVATSPIQIVDGYVPVSVTSQSNMRTFDIRFINTKTHELYNISVAFGSDSTIAPTVSAATKIGTVFHGDKLFTGYVGVGSGLSIEKISLGEFYNTWSIITNKYVTGPTSIASYGPNKINEPSKVFLYSFS